MRARRDRQLQIPGEVARGRHAVFGTVAIFLTQVSSWQAFGVDGAGVVGDQRTAASAGCRPMPMAKRDQRGHTPLIGPLHAYKSSRVSDQWCLTPLIH
jgi:hypothetical protein